MILLHVLIAMLTGAANPFQSGTNAELNTELGRGLWATLVVYATGLLGVAVIALMMREPVPAISRAMHVRWWAWAGGLISIAPTMAGVFLAQRMGSGSFTAVSVTAAIVTSVLLDHFGLIGFARHPASLIRVAGCTLMIAGVWVVSRF
jgi:bacterial/archaeal transporter family-2 protein